MRLAAPLVCMRERNSSQTRVRIFYMTDLSDTAARLLTDGKGILAADESTESADKRLAAHDIKASPEMRRLYRDLFLNAPGIEQYLSGVILYKETLEQKGLDGKNFSRSLSARGIIPGIKVDEGTEPLEGSAKELITKGVLGLCARLTEYHKEYDTGFTKWRAVIRIDGTSLPSSAALVENARRLAVYALDAQEVAMVPIIEPEVLYEGTHSRVRCRQVLEETLRVCFGTLTDHGVDLSGVILKTSMVLSGEGTKKRDAPEDVASDTIDALLQAVPREVPGVVFLSGGQSPEQAVENLRAICAYAKEKNVPWKLTFSFARALQDEALAIWQGKDENVETARAAFIERLKKVSEALG